MTSNNEVELTAYQREWCHTEAAWCQQNYPRLKAEAAERRQKLLDMGLVPITVTRWEPSGRPASVIRPRE